MSITVTGTWSRAFSARAKVYVLDNAAAVQNGVTNVSLTLTTPQLATGTMTKVGSLVYGGFTNQSTTLASSILGNTTSVDNTAIGGDSISAIWKSAAVTAATTSATYGWGAPTVGSTTAFACQAEIVNNGSTLSEDASSPALASGTGSVVSPSFTPPGTSCLLFIGNSDWDGGSGMTFAVTDSANGYTWTKIVDTSSSSAATTVIYFGVPKSGNNLTAGALSMAPAQLAGTLNNAIRLTAGNLSMAPLQLAGTLNNPVNLSGNMGMTFAAQLAGIIGTQKNLTAGALSMATAQLSGLISSGNATEQLLINGMNIMVCAESFAADLSGPLSVPLVRTANIAVPGKQGLVNVPRKLYDRAQIPITIWVRGMNSDGTYPAESARDAKFYANLDQLMQMFAVSGYVTLTHTTPAGTIRQITGQVLQALTPARYAWSMQSTGNLAVIIECTDPFWREPTTVTDTITAPTTTPVVGQLSHQDGCTAPVEDAVVTFAGPCSNPRLACGAWFVQYSGTLTGGQSVTIDVGNWALSAVGFTPSYAALVHAGLGPWIIFAPAPPGSGGPSVTYSITAGGSSACTVTAKRAFLGG